MLIYFDAERAVRAALGSIDAVHHLDVKVVELQARIGFATGLVVVGDLIGEGSAGEQSVAGAPQPRSPPSNVGRTEHVPLQLLKTLPLDGVIITGDAIFTQREICRVIIDGGGDYFFTVKACPCEGGGQPANAEIRHCLGLRAVFPLCGVDAAARPAAHRND